MSRTLDDVVEELGEAVSGLRSELAGQSVAVRTELGEAVSGLRSELAEQSAGLRSELAEQSAALRSELAEQSAALRSGQEDFKEELLRALAGISTQQASFITLLTRLLNDREEADRRFARLEAAVFGSKH